MDGSCQVLLAPKGSVENCPQIHDRAGTCFHYFFYVTCAHHFILPNWSFGLLICKMGENRKSVYPSVGRSMRTWGGLTVSIRSLVPYRGAPCWWNSFPAGYFLLPVGDLLSWTGPWASTVSMKLFHNLEVSESVPELSRTFTHYMWLFVFK